MAVLTVENLGVEVDGRTLLREASFTLDAGECTAIIGASGLGKSVIIRALCGLHPASGRVVVGDVASDNQGWRAVQARLGVLMSLPGLLDDLTLFDNVAFKLRRDGVPEDEVRSRVMHILEEFGIGGSAEKLPAALSGGMRRRGALARALVHRPLCLLLDDPTAGLDPITTAQVITFILEMARSRGAAVVLTTHDLQHVGARAHRVMLLRDQRLRPADGGPETLARELGA